MSYSFRTSLFTIEISFDCWEKLDCSSINWADRRADKTMVVAMVVLGLGS